MFRNSVYRYAEYTAAFHGLTRLRANNSQLYLQVRHLLIRKYFVFKFDLAYNMKIAMDRSQDESQ